MSAPDDMDEIRRKQGQVEYAKRLQDLILKRWEEQLVAGTLSDTGMATLVRFLQAGGWTIDPAMVPKGLRGVLTRTISAAKLDLENDPDLRGVN